MDVSHNNNNNNNSVYFDISAGANSINNKKIYDDAYPKEYIYNEEEDIFDVPARLYDVKVE